jgi:hypothetical protein
VDQSDDWSGRRVGKYQLARRIGRGAMGQVYEGTDRHLRRPVAVKLIPADPETLPRLLREGRAAARVTHPNVVTVYDIGRDRGTFYIVMELVPGPTAQALVARRGALPWTEATALAAAACRGLYAAHRAGLIHRDVKPANILCPPGAEPKLADFGLARPALVRTQLTHANTILGTPEYMSPEQCRGEQLDPRTDIYSLGVVYYFLLTGELPFRAADRAAIMFAHCTAPVPDPRTVNPAVPEGCAALVARALAKRRADRYLDCRAMSEALAALLSGTGIELPALSDAQVRTPPMSLDPGEADPGPTVPIEPLSLGGTSQQVPVRRGRWRTARWALVPLALVLLTATGFLAFRRPPAERAAEVWPLGAPAPGAVVATPKPPSEVGALAREWGLPAEAGRGVWAAPEPYWFATAGPAQSRALTLWDANRKARVLPTTANVLAVAHPPGGRWLAVATADRRVSLLTGPEFAPAGRIETDGPVAALAAHGPLLAVATGTGVSLFDVSNPAAPMALTLSGTACPGALALAFSADGSFLAALMPGVTVQVWDVANRRERVRAVFGGLTATGFAFGAEPGQLAVVGQRNGRAAVFAWNRVGQEAPHEVRGPPVVSAVAPARPRPELAAAGGGWLGLLDAFGPTGGARPLGNRLPASPVRVLIAAPTGKHFVCGYEDGAVDVWAAREGP